MNTILFKTRMLYFFCCAAIAVSISACSMQEEIFDLADGTDMILAVGYDTTTKIISIEPDVGHLKVYDTGIATNPSWGAVLHDHRDCFWFLITIDVYKWNFSENSTPTLIYTAVSSPGTIGVSDEGKVIFYDGTNLYSINEDGTYNLISIIDAAFSFYQDLFFRDGDGALILTQEYGNIERLSSGTLSNYATASYTPVLASQVSFLRKINGELFVGTIGGRLYRDFYSNGVNFVEAITQLTVGPASGVAYYVVSNTVWYIAYQENTGMDIIVLRYDNGIPSTVVSIPTTGDANVFLRHYKDDRFILGVGNTVSAQGLYVIDAGKKSYTLLSGSYRIYGLSRVHQ